MKSILTPLFLLVVIVSYCQTRSFKFDDYKVFYPQPGNHSVNNSVIKNNESGEMHLPLNSSTSENLSLKATPISVSNPLFNDYSIICKYDKSDDVLWHRLLVSNSRVSNQFLELDSVGNIYAAGFYRDSLFILSGGISTLIAHNSSGLNQFYIVKFSPQGTFLWCRFLSQAPHSMLCRGISVSRSGQLGAMLTFRPDTIYKLNGEVNSIFKRENPPPSFLIASSFGCFYLSSNGNFLAEYQTRGNVTTLSALRITSDNENNVYISGKSSGFSNLFHDDSQTKGFGSGESFLLKLSKSGKYLWHKAYGIGNPIISNTMFNLSGNSLYVFLVNGSKSNLYFPLDTLKFAGDSLGFSAGYTSSILFRIDTADGDITWLRAYWTRMNNTAIIGTNSMFIDNNDNFYMLSAFNDRISIHTDYDSLFILNSRKEPSPSNPSIDESLALIRINANGSFSYGRVFGDLSEYENLNLFAKDDSIRISGLYKHEPNINPGADTSLLPFNSLSNRQFFIADYSECSGSIQIIYDSICNGQNAVYNGIAYNSTGVYPVYFNSSFLCDSIVIFNLHVTFLNFVVGIHDGRFQVQSNEPFKSYQWFECLPNGSKVDIPGANSSDFTPPKPGDYGVRVSLNNCTRESNCITYVSVDEFNEEYSFELFPNPTDGFINLEHKGYIGRVHVEVFDLLGRSVLKTILDTNIDTKIEVKQLKSGIYNVFINTENSEMIQKLIINR